MLPIICPDQRPTPLSELPTGSVGLLQSAHWLNKEETKTKQNSIIVVIFFIILFS